MATDSVTRPLPGSYSEMYPGRFLKADMLKGKKVTVTIVEIIGEDLIGENNKAKAEWIVKIKERPLQLVLNKTNAFCLYRMFGGDPHSWLNKRITLYPTTTKFGRDTLDCLRIWGSPDIAEDMPITVPQGRKKAWETVMHRMNGKSTDAAPMASAMPPASAPALDPRVTTAFGILGWTPAEQNQFIVDRVGKSQADLLAELNRIIDEANQAEEA